MTLPDPDLRTHGVPDAAEPRAADRVDGRLVGRTAGIHADIGAGGADTPGGGTVVTWPGTSFPLLTQPHPSAPS
jgi:hypothetical protein